MQKHPRPLTWISLLLALGLTGCTSTKAIQAEQQSTLTMTEIYDSTAGTKQVRPEAGPSLGEVRQTTVNESPKVNYVAYTRTADNEVSTLFKPLPNPEIPVYVFPHLAQMNNDDLPVPGYTTAFFLYPHEEYALPSEEE